MSAALYTRVQSDTPYRLRMATGAAEAVHGVLDHATAEGYAQAYEDAVESLRPEAD